MNISITDMPDNSYLHIAAVLVIVDKSRQELIDLISTGAFPQPRMVNDGIASWLVGDIKGWILANNTVTQ